MTSCTRVVFRKPIVMFNLYNTLSESERMNLYEILHLYVTVSFFFLIISKVKH